MGDKKKGFFGRLVEGLTKTRDSIVSGIDSVFSGFSAIDDDFYEEIEETLIMGDLGIQTTMAIVEDLRKKVKENHIKDPAECKDLLIASIKEQMDLGENAYEFENRKSVVLVIGVNGVGKTTSVGKLAGQLKDQGKKVILAVGILLMLIFSKYFYMASISSYYTFYLMHKFGLTVQNAQLHLFAFLFAVAAGTVIGGPVGDKIGRKYVIWGSILGVAPFTLVLPYASLEWTGILTVIIGFILASAFSAILVYAQELLPGRIGMVSGLFFGFAFGMGGLGAAVLGLLADHTSIDLVYKICAFLPLLGFLTIFLPDNRQKA